MEVVGDVYDASLDPALWPVAFEKASRYIGGTSVSLTSQDLVARKSNLYFSAGHDPDFLQRCLDRYGTITPLFPTVYFHDLERRLGVPDCLPIKEFCRTRFATEWVLPLGIVDTMLTNLEKSSVSCAVFTVMFHAKDGLATDETRRRFSLVAPHVRRALLIGKVIDLHKIEAAALADTLDALSSGMFIVDATSASSMQMPRGHAMLNDANVMRGPAGRLLACDPKAAQTLAEVFQNAEGGDGVIGRKGIAVPLPARWRRWC